MPPPRRLVSTDFVLPWRADRGSLSRDTHSREGTDDHHRQRTQRDGLARRRPTTSQPTSPRAPRTTTRTTPSSPRTTPSCARRRCSPRRCRRSSAAAARPIAQQLRDHPHDRPRLRLDRARVLDALAPPAGAHLAAPPRRGPAGGAAPSAHREGGADPGLDRRLGLARRLRDAHQGERQLHVQGAQDLRQRLARLAICSSRPASTTIPRRGRRSCTSASTCTARP